MDTTVTCRWTALPTGPIFLLATYDTYSPHTTCRQPAAVTTPGCSCPGSLLLGGCEALSLTEQTGPQQKCFRWLFQADGVGQGPTPHDCLTTPKTLNSHELEDRRGAGGQGCPCLLPR